MESIICRAITFINYNMPIRMAKTDWKDFDKYCTTGFFDEMYTRTISLDYKEDQLKELWKYSLNCVKIGKGTYAHQNIFCFSKDEWNDNCDEHKIEDNTFWHYDDDVEEQLVFVVFLQTQQYAHGIEAQCRQFSKAASEALGNFGYAYVYATVDKNDFVVCIRSSDYKAAVNAIMMLHEIDGVSIVYSYSVFGIADRKLKNMSEDDRIKLNNQKIDSISLKGVTNSTRTVASHNETLYRKYYDFCNKFVSELYKNYALEEQDYKIYDILGDDDFRLIARQVPLGNLLKQFGKDGLLNYENSATQFAFFSTQLVLNTKDEAKQNSYEEFEPMKILEQTLELNNIYKSEHCKHLMDRMDCLYEKLTDDKHKDYKYVEKMTTAWHGTYQLLQSLTALEAAPTKKYDFYSLFIPMNTLVKILEKYFEKDEQLEELAENENLYEFIHKVSMTLHGTLRTDIQFFQIRDFNATVHYAPAKLRAYYSLLVHEISNHVKSVSSNGGNDPEPEHSYIFCPGIFENVRVSQLCEKPSEKQKLMLITVPERYLYFPQNLTIILAHEVGHFAGEVVRKRRKRFKAILKCTCRVMGLEIVSLVQYQLKKYEFDVPVKPFEEDAVFDIIWGKIENQYKDVDEKNTMYYAKRVLKTVQNAYWDNKDNSVYFYFNKYCTELYRRLKEKCIDKNGKLYKDNASEAKRISHFINELSDEMESMYDKYMDYVLEQLIRLIIYDVSEALSDILAILILGLSPKEYISSMNDEVRDFNIDDIDECLDGQYKIRIALVIETMGKLQEKYAKERIGEIINGWENPYKNLHKELTEDTIEFKLVTKVYYYTSIINDKMAIDEQHIFDYKSLYNKKNGQYQDKVYDFCTDLVFYETMQKYLVECGSAYMDQLYNNDIGITNKDSNWGNRQRVADLFKKTGSSVTELMDEIEKFLEGYKLNEKN